MNKWVCVGFLTVHFFAVAQDELSYVGEKVLPSPAQLSQAVLGKGYDVTQERFAGDCITGSLQYVGAPQASVSFERSLSSNEMSDSLGFSAGARARYGLISGSAAARFASESISDEYSEVTIYASEYRFKNVKMTQPSFTQQGMNALNGDGNFVGEIWERTCGQGYVEQIELGAKFMVSAKVEFSKKEDKHSFAAEFKIKGPAFSVRAELSKAARRFGKTASVSIRAFQLGGDVSRISDLFGVGEKAKIDIDGQKVHALLVCSMDKLDACLQVLENAIAYGTDTSEPLSFPNQIRPNYDPSQPNGPAELAYVVKPWSDVAVYLEPQIMKAVTRQARSELARRFEELLKMRTRVNALLSGPFRLSARQYNLVDGAAHTLNLNLVAIKEAVALCYSEPDKCPDRVHRLKNELQVVPDSVLEIYPESFAQWCDLYESGVIRNSARKTVAALLDIVAGELDDTRSVDKCLMAQGILGEKREINLASRGIESLSPLADLIMVERLYLYQNSISDLGPLKHLTRLRDLNLNTNDIADLSPLYGLHGIERLYVSNNRLEWVDGAMSWPKIRLLSIGDNRLTNVAFLANLGSLEELDVSNNKLKDIEDIRVLKELRVLSVSQNKILRFDPLLGLENLQSLRVSNNPGLCPPELKGLCDQMDY